MRLLRLAGTVALTVVLAGCWTAPGAGPDNSGYNPFEQGLTVANAATLAHDWTWETEGAVRGPIVTPGGVHAMVGHLLVTADPQTGEERWRRVVFDPGGSGVPTSSTLLGYVVGEVLVSVHVHRDFIPGAGTYSFDAITGAPRGTVAGSGNVVPRDARLVRLWSNFGGSGIAIAGYSVTDRAHPERSWQADLGLGGPGDFGPLGLAVGLNGFSFTSGSSLRAYPFTEPAGCNNPPEAPQFRFCPPSWSKALVRPLSAPALTRDQSEVIVVDAGHVTSVHPGTGATLWTATLPTASAFPVVAAAAAAERRVFVPNGDRLLVFDRNACTGPTCTPAWSAAIGGTTGFQPVVAGGVVYTATTNGILRAFRAAGCGQATCAPVWEHALGADVTGAPAVSDGHLYVGTSDGRLVAFAPTG